MVLEATRAHRTGAAVIFDRPKARQIMLESIDWNDPSRRQYYERNSEYIGQVDSLEACLEDDDPIQVMFTGPFEEVRKAMAILQELPAAETYSLAITEYEAKNFSILDVISRNCSKGTTLEEWARRRGIARDEVMAVGDNWNDHDMLEFARLSGRDGQQHSGIEVARLAGYSVERRGRPGRGDPYIRFRRISIQA